MEIQESHERIRIQWLRGGEDLDLNDPLIFLILGRRGGGKSVLLESLGEAYLESSHNVLDLFGSSDGEGLAWLRSPWVKESDLPVLLVCGEHVKISSKWPSKPWTQLSLQDFEDNRIVISSTPLYGGDKGEEFGAAGRILDILFQRGAAGWSKKIYVIIREASDLFYSRVKLRATQKDSKAVAIYLMRESRHHGLALGLDSQKLTSVDSDFRQQTDYLILKAMGIDSLPDDLKFTYRYLDPIWLRAMKPWEFGVIAGKGALGLGVNVLNPWHKRDREHILGALGIHVEKVEAGP